MPQSNPVGEQLIATIDHLFFSGTSTWLNNLTDSSIESLFSSALEVESEIKMILEGESGTQEFNQHQLQFRNKNWFVSDFEMACDCLLTIFFTNTKHITGRHLARAINIYMSILPAARYDNLNQKWFAQCAMSNIALTVMADCELDNTEQDFYNVMISRELPMLIDRGKYGFPDATTLIQNMMITNILSVKALLEALLLYENHSILQMFVHDTIVKTLQKVDDHYTIFWKLLVNIEERSLVPKLSDKFPNFLSSLELFISCCGDGMKVTVNENNELQWDCQEALMNNEELVTLIKSVVHYGGISGTSIKETITKRQQKSMDEAASDHTSVWIELGQACFNLSGENVGL